jgi:hypothetical protein
MVPKERAIVDTRLKDLRVIRLLLITPSRVNEQQGELLSPHPFIARIALTCTLLLPLLIALLLFLLLGTAPSAVVEFFLIHLTLVIYGALVWGGLVSLWPLVGCIRRMDIQMSLSRLNHWLPGRETHPEVVEGTTDFHHDIADALFPEAEPVFDNATALHAAVDMLDPEPARVEGLVGLLLLSCQRLSAEPVKFEA